MNFDWNSSFFWQNSSYSVGISSEKTMAPEFLKNSWRIPEEYWNNSEYKIQKRSDFSSQNVLSISGILWMAEITVVVDHYSLLTQIKPDIWKSSSILLHSGLNQSWHFWLSTRKSCSLKMKSVENTLGHIGEQPLENL